MSHFLTTSSNFVILLTCLRTSENELYGLIAGVLAILINSLCFLANYPAKEDTHEASPELNGECKSKDKSMVRFLS